jgi:hypothetical protein
MPRRPCFICAFCGLGNTGGGLSWGDLKKGKFTYAKERCLLVERSAKASREER